MYISVMRLPRSKLVMRNTAKEINLKTQIMLVYTYTSMSIMLQQNITYTTKFKVYANENFKVNLKCN
jgi:hypothetical protein